MSNLSLIKCGEGILVCMDLFLSKLEPFLFKTLAEQNCIHKDTVWLKLFTKISPRLCGEGRDECQFYQDGAHAELRKSFRAHKTHISSFKVF